MSLLALDDTQRAEFARLASVARPENRRKLGCLLANLRAMALATSRPAGERVFIVEDNVRILRSGETAMAAAAALNAAADDEVDLCFLGYLAHGDVLATLAEACAASEASGAVLTPHLPDQQRGSSTELWGTYAYCVSRRFFEYLVTLGLEPGTCALGLTAVDPCALFPRHCAHS